MPRLMDARRQELRDFGSLQLEVYTLGIFTLGICLKTSLNADTMLCICSVQPIPVQSRLPPYYVRNQAYIRNATTTPEVQRLIRPIIQDSSCSLHSPRHFFSLCPVCSALPLQDQLVARHLVAMGISVDHRQISVTDPKNVKIMSEQAYFRA